MRARSMAIGMIALLTSLNACKILNSERLNKRNSLPKSGADDIVKGENSLVADTVANFPACEKKYEGYLGYATAEKKLYVCQAKSWTIVHVDGKDGEDGTTKFLATQTDEPAGQNCRYSGKKVSSGADADNNNTLDAAEITSNIFICEGSVNAIAVSQFSKYVHSIAIVIVSIDSENCDQPGTMHKVPYQAGTGWLINKSNADAIIMTNGHVIDTTYMTEDDVYPCGNPAPANSDGKTQVYYDVYLPKTSTSADTIRKQGLPGIVGFNPSLTAFDVFAAQAADLSIYSFSNDGADMGLLRIGSVGDRAVLDISQLSPSDTSANVLRTSDEVFTIGYSLANGPRLAVGSVFQIEKCRNFITNYGSYDPDICKDWISVNADDYIFSFYGYGDHGGSGSPVLDRFGQVAGILTFGHYPDQSDFVAVQMAKEIRDQWAKTRVWTTNFRFPFE